MVLHYLWFSFFAIAFLVGIYQSFFLGNTDIFSLLVQATFDMAKLGAEIAIGLIGVLCLWLGFFKIAERSGLITLLATLLNPLFRHLMPEVPANHPAFGSITMNLAANMLGLDNAATPLGLKAMKDLQTVNSDKNTASNAQILFLVLNTSSVTLLPITIFLYRIQQGSTDPTIVFIPILLATSASTLVGILTVAWIQRLRVFHPVVLAYFALFAILITGFVFYLSQLSPLALSDQSSFIGNFILFLTIIIFLGYGFLKKVHIYDAFISGAKQGIMVSVRLIPYLIAMLVAIGVFRASGALDFLLSGIEKTIVSIGGNTEFIQALPTALMKPLSGSGARAMMLETMSTHGVDSFPALLAATIQGSTETTFYVLAVYFGSVGIKRIRYALACGLIADIAGITTAILIGYWFFY